MYRRGAEKVASRPLAPLPSSVADRMEMACYFVGTHQEYDFEIDGKRDDVANRWARARME